MVNKCSSYNPIIVVIVTVDVVVYVLVVVHIIVAVHIMFGCDQLMFP